MALIDNIVAYWKLDESSGNAADSTGNGYTLTIQGTTTYSPALIANGGDLGSTDANSNGFSRGDGMSIDLSGASSVSLWVKFTGTPIGIRRLMTWGSTTGTSRYFQLNYDDATTTLTVNASNSNINATIDLTDSAWHQVGYTCSAAGATTLYHNGTSVATGSRSTDTASAQFAIGNVSAFNFGSPAIFDEIGTWSKELTSAEMTELYNSGIGLSYPFTGASSNSNFLMFM